MATILVVFHTLSGNTKAAADAVVEGIEEMPGVDALLKPALQAQPDDLRQCDGIACGTPDYFSYMAGGLKDFFDRCYYPTQGEVTDLPCGVFVTHGGGGTAADSVVSLCRTFQFHLVADPVLVRNGPGEKEREELKSMGRLLAERSLSR